MAGHHCVTAVTRLGGNMINTDHVITGITAPRQVCTLNTLLSYPSAPLCPSVVTWLHIPRMASGIWDEDIQEVALFFGGPFFTNATCTTTSVFLFRASQSSGAGCYSPLWLLCQRQAQGTCSQPSGAIREGKRYSWLNKVCNIPIMLRKGEWMMHGDEGEGRRRTRHKHHHHLLSFPAGKRGNSSGDLPLIPTQKRFFKFIC